MLPSFTARDQQTQCGYCAADLTLLAWDSSFETKQFYKTIKCNCGKHLHIRVTKFMGSGHDSWDGTHAWKDSPDVQLDRVPRSRILTIEDKVEIIDKGKAH